MSVFKNPSTAASQQGTLRYYIESNDLRAAFQEVNGKKELYIMSDMRVVSHLGKTESSGYTTVTMSLYNVSERGLE